MQVESVFLHSGYDSWTVENDICLLKLQEAAQLNDYVDTIPLPTIDQAIFIIQSFNDNDNGQFIDIQHKST